jgi:hypothetical protein
MEEAGGGEAGGGFRGGHALHWDAFFPDEFADRAAPVETLEFP